jgi:hypothetical protein
MSNRSEIVDLIEWAIDAHRRNIAMAELKKAQLGLVAPEVLDDSINSSSAEIDRLCKMKEHVLNNGKGAPSNGERLDQLSAQISGLQGQVSTIRYELVDVANAVGELRDGCPLFNPDTPEGPLIFVRKRSQD